MRAITCLIALALFLVPHAASADRIALYSDASGNCNLSLTGDISWQFHVYHESTSGATGSDFRISFDWGSGGGSVLVVNTPYADPPYNWVSGLTLNYGSCRTGTFYVATLIITGFTNEPCEAFVHVLNASIQDCGGVWQTATGGTLTLDGNESCSCNAPVSAEPTTWSRIKALYR